MKMKAKLQGRIDLSFLTVRVLNDVARVFPLLSFPEVRHIV